MTHTYDITAIIDCYDKWILDNKIDPGVEFEYIGKSKAGYKFVFKLNGNEVKVIITQKKTITRYNIAEYSDKPTSEQEQNVVNALLNDPKKAFKIICDMGEAVGDKDSFTPDEII